MPKAGKLAESWRNCPPKNIEIRRPKLRPPPLSQPRSLGGDVLGSLDESWGRDEGDEDEDENEDDQSHNRGLEVVVVVVDDDDDDFLKRISPRIMQ